jgi:GDPmannose 4,6-dehydratase
MPTALITGITGQDGGYLAERLLDEDWKVHGLVRAGDGHVDELRRRTPSVELHEGDLADAAAMYELVDEVAPDEIYNLGGISSVALSWEHPLLTAQVSGLGAGAVLEAGWRLKQRSGREVRVLQASSAEMFGMPAQSPQSETTPIAPVSPYGAAKAFAHHLVGVYRARGLHTVSCILYNHESPRRPLQFVTRKITRAAALIAAGRQDSLVLGNLDARRDWGWAPEYVDAMIRAIRYRDPDDFVIATGVSHSVADFVATAFAHVGLGEWRRYVSLDDGFARPMDVAEFVGDATKARTLLNWRPIISFDDMVRRMVEHDMDDIAQASGTTSAGASRGASGG